MTCAPDQAALSFAWIAVMAFVVVLLLVNDPTGAARRRPALPTPATPARVEPQAVRATVSTPGGSVELVVTVHLLEVNRRKIPWSAVREVRIDETNALVVRTDAGRVLPSDQRWNPAALLAVHQACHAAIERARSLEPPDPAAQAALDRLRSDPTRRS